MLGSALQQSSLGSDPGMADVTAKVMTSVTHRTGSAAWASARQLPSVES